MSAYWLLIIFIAGLIGTGMFVYGIRQREPQPVIFGLAISALPALVRAAWLSGLIAGSLVALFVVIRRNQ